MANDKPIYPDISDILARKAEGRRDAARRTFGEKIAWADGSRVAFGEKKYLGSSRWIVVNDIGVTLYSETNPQTPNAQKPANGIMLGPADMEELFALVGKDTPVIVK